MSDLHISQLGGTIGATVEGFDLDAPWSDADVALLRQAFLDHRVLVFRGSRPPTPDEQLAVARHFGDVTTWSLDPGQDAERPEIVHIDSEKQARLYRSRADDTPAASRVHDPRLQWHVDLSYRAEPSVGAVLSAQVLPDAGGDTAWFDLIGAYRVLSPAFQDFVSRLWAVHDASLRIKFTDTSDPTGVLRERLDASPPVLHPLVRFHPETREPVLYLSPGFITHIDGVTAEESALLLDFLYGLFARPELTLRWHWQLGDFILYDNRATAHFAVRDYGDAYRRMFRVTLGGDLHRGPLHSDPVLVGSAP